MHNLVRQSATFPPGRAPTHINRTSSITRCVSRGAWETDLEVRSRHLSGGWADDDEQPPTRGGWARPETPLTLPSCCSRTGSRAKIFLSGDARSLERFDAHSNGIFIALSGLRHGTISLFCKWPTTISREQPLPASSVAWRCGIEASSTLAGSSQPHRASASDTPRGDRQLPRTALHALNGILAIREHAPTSR